METCVRSIEVHKGHVSIDCGEAVRSLLGRREV